MKSSRRSFCRKTEEGRLNCTARESHWWYFISHEIYDSGLEGEEVEKKSRKRNYSVQMSKLTQVPQGSTLEDLGQHTKAENFQLHGTWVKSVWSAFLPSFLPLWWLSAQSTIKTFSSNPTFSYKHPFPDL